MKLTAKLLAHLHECYHPGEAVLKSEPAALDALMEFAKVMLPLRDALVAMFAAKAKERVEIAATRGMVHFGSRADCAVRVCDAARKTFDKLARKLVEKDANKGADDV